MFFFSFWYLENNAKCFGMRCLEHRENLNFYIIIVIVVNLFLAHRVYRSHIVFETTL